MSDLSEKLEKVTAKLTFEQERQTILRPYLVPTVKRGVIGESRYAVRLRSQIKTASNHRDPVLIFGEPGLEKDNIAALIHFGSSQRRQPIVKIDCSKLQVSGADLWGRVGGKMGLLEAVGEGTIILNNIQDTPKELYKGLAELLTENTYYPVSRGVESSLQKKESKARIILISEQIIEGIDPYIKSSIKVPPLRVRKADIDNYINYYINVICRARKVNKPQLTPEALRRLQDYDFPNNIRELESLVFRAMTQLEGYSEITEEIIWPSQGKKQQFRVNLLNQYPSLRRFLRSPWYPTRINYGITTILFAFIVIILFVAPQDREHNFALNLFWAWWWPISLLIFPFLGRIWCSFCPFMIYGEITQKLSLWLLPRTLKKWPRQTAEKWGGWFLLTLFALILLWEELWDLSNTAYLSSWLLLLITAGAMICSTIFERRFWCRYLCPIGGMNGMFAKLSITELRAQQGTCSAECNTYQCYKGGSQKGEGLETNGCPLYSHPAQLNDNRDCVLCMTCLKACPHRSIRVNLRPPGIEIWTTHIPRTYEVGLLFLLFNLVLLHCLPQLVEQFSIKINLANFTIHSLIAILILSLPTLFSLIAFYISRSLLQYFSNLKPRSFTELAYGYLPLVLAGNLAYYLHLFLGEAGKILPVTLATFGLSGIEMPILVTHPAVISFLQSVTLIVGALCGILLTQKIAKQPFQFLLPQHLTICGFSLLFRQLII
ncbi:MAG: sigma 54-interacting transcriptional regulator [Microcystaceae cyanobacterium]